ncbi:N/A [soil metagenome]
MAAALAGCASGGAPGSSAVASVKAVYGSVPSGNVSFTQQGPDTLVYAHFAGFPINAIYAFHVHEKGDCSGTELMAAGGIYNPTGKPHGPQDREHMVGDMPSLVGDTEGLADARFVLKGVSVSDLIGRSVIVHGYPDDYRTQPEGASGARTGCGVIKA